MRVMLRSPLLGGVLLLAVAPPVLAETPLPDPIPPAVIGRPLDQIGPARPAAKKSAPEKAARSKPAAEGPATSTKVARQPAAAPQALAAVPAAPPEPADSQRRAKQAVDDRADPRMRSDDVGKGTHFARKPLGPGAYFGERHRIAVRKYYQEHPVAGGAAKWKIGEPVPRGAALAAVPDGLLASLPAVPPGHRYVQLGGEVVLIAAASKMVVDGISRRPR